MNRKQYNKLERHSIVCRCGVKVSTRSVAYSCPICGTTLCDPVGRGGTAHMVFDYKEDIERKDNKSITSKNIGKVVGTLFADAEAIRLHIIKNVNSIGIVQTEKYLTYSIKNDFAQFKKDFGKAKGRIVLLIDADIHTILTAMKEDKRKEKDE